MGTLEPGGDGHNTGWVVKGSQARRRTAAIAPSRVASPKYLVRKVLQVAQDFQPVRTTWRERRPAPPYFSCFTGGPQAHEELLRKVFGGTGILPVRRTGWKPVPPKTVGSEICPTDFSEFILVPKLLLGNDLFGPSSGLGTIIFKFRRAVPALHVTSQPVLLLKAAR